MLKMITILKVFLSLTIFKVIQSQSCSNASTPNIILFLTDDQDVFLSGMEPMIKTREWFKNGQVFENAFVSTPICCPSRSSILTGRYQHNTHVYNNSVIGNCYGKEWTSAFGLESRSTFAAILHEKTNYQTFYAGKYLNQYHGKAVPKGWHYWAGLIGNSRYYNYRLNINGRLEKHGRNYEDDYLTDLLGRLALDFLNDRLKNATRCGNFYELYRQSPILINFTNSQK